MNDRELLELAAKAAGLDLEWCEPWKCMAKNIGVIDGFDSHTCWDSLKDDGDALRLAVKLAIPFHVFYEGGSVVAYGKKTKHHPEGLDIQELFTSDPYEATRRAITRAAAQIQLNKEQDNGK